MKKGTRIFLISLIVILMLAIIAAFTYCTINKYAHAEYADITQDTIVNFNQYIQNNFTHNYIMSADTSTNISSLSANEGDIFYLKLYYTISSGAFIINLRYNDNSTETIAGSHLTNGQDKIFTLPKKLDSIYYYSNSANNRIDSIMFINLTQMFGSNTPNLEECEKLFNVPYYNYNEGTPMFFGLNQNDLLQHIEYRLNTGTITGYSQNITNTQVSFNNQGQLFLSGVASENYSGYFLINLKTTIPIGSVVTLNFNSYIKQSGISVALCYANLEEKYITDIPTSTNANSPFTYSFVTWEETSAFYLICSNYSTGTILTINDATISVQASNDYQFNLQAQYDLGYNDATTYYTQGYGRQEIWTKGFNEGKAKGLQEANGTFTAMDYVKSAFVTLGDIMNIEVFPNFTLGAFFLLPLITGAIFFIIKISKGG